MSSEPISEAALRVEYELARDREAPANVLVLVEWVDSARPVAEWRFLSDAPEPTVIECKSVGWVVRETESVLMLAPNIGDVGTESEQGCGFIRIPKASITRRASVKEAP